MSRHTKLANTAQSTIILNIQRATLGDFKNSQSAAKGFPEARYLNSEELSRIKSSPLPTQLSRLGRS